jgi:hypothetical protein
VSELVIELGFEEAETLRALLGGAEREVRELRLVDGDRLLQSVRTDTGPARSATAIGTAVAMRAQRVVVLDAAALSLEPIVPLAFDATPPWVPALDAVSARLRWLRVPARRLLQDGAYGLSVIDDDLPARTICCRVRAGCLERLVGGRSLGLEPEEAEDPLALGSLGALRAVLESRRPGSVFERSGIRGEICMARLSPRLAATLIALRLLGL